MDLPVNTGAASRVPSQAADGAVSGYLQHPLAGLFILAAIPVVAFALWSDYFERRVQASHKDPEFNRASELQSLHWASILSLIAQTFLYLGSRPIRLEYPVASLFLFLGAILVQIRLQNAVEARVRAITQTQEQAAETLAAAGRATRWIALGILVYFGSIIGTGSLFYGVARLSGAPDGAVALFGFLGTSLGIFVGLALTYAMAPIHLRKIFRCAPLEDEESGKLIREAFSSGGVAVPRVFVLETEQFRGSNALLAGFNGLKGGLAPALFLSRSLVRDFPKDQLRAVLLHEVAHLKHRHIRARFTYAAAIVLCSVIASTLALVVAHLFLPDPLVALIRLALPLVAFLIPFHLIRKQVRLQEHEADLTAVLDLGADLDSYEKALKGLDQANLRAGGITPPANAQTHPLTEERLQILRVAVARKLAAQTGAQDPNSQDQKAA